MRPSPLHLIVSVACAAGAVACLEVPGLDLPALRLGPLGQLSITVTGFSVPLMSDACFSVTVYGTEDPAQRDAAHEVWTQPSLCTSQYGAEDLILDVAGACDPAAPGAAHTNAVRLVLNDLYMGGAAGGDGVALSPDFYSNPCPAGGDDCILTAPCDDAGVTGVDFDLVVAAHPDLGIYDARMTLGDVFCAAKLDCVDHGGATLQYLADPQTGVDGPTAVLGFACRAGADASGTYLYLDDLVITCDNGWTATVDPSGDVGYVSATDPHELLFASAINRGDASAGTSYWNVLLGLNLDHLHDAGTCTLTTQGTASETALCETPEQSRYPVIRWQVDLSEGDVRACGRHALDLGDGAVASYYTPMSATTGFDYRMAHGDAGVVEDLAAVTCGCAPGSQVFDVTGSSQTFVVPEGCTEISVKLWGAGGGGSTGGGGYRYRSAGGGGGFAAGTLAVAPGDVLTILVGEGGRGSDHIGFTPFGGGTAAWGYQGGGGGGGRSAIRLPGGAEVITAGGGGGGGYGNGAVNPAPGGGLIGGTSGGTARDGGGGTQVAEGGGGVGGSGNGVAGGPFQGGAAGYYGGGGGGGYFGGGGGAGQSGVGTGSGGGGSGYVGGVSGGWTIGGSGQAPAGGGDAGYVAPVGVGGGAGAVGTWGSGQDGGPGRVIISW